MTRADMDLVLTEAFRLVKGNHIKKESWTTWDVFAGRNIDNEESNESFIHRVIQTAIKNLGVKDD